jgi:predicted nucleic acid-binding protein
VTCLYLDMNVYNRPFDDQRQMRIQLETVAITIIFALIETGVLSARWSFVLEYENSRNPSPERKALVRHLSQSCDNTVEPDESIRELAKRLSETYSVRGRDALHLACADLSDCDYLVTCDDRLVHRGQRLREEGILRVRVVNPLDLVREV